MNYKIQEQPYIDIDWFAVDKNGLIIHFASGGGLLPKSVAHSKSNIEKLSTYFRSLPIANHEVLVNKSLHDFVQIQSEKEEVNYLSDFLSMARRGLYSFDKSNPGDFFNRDYHFVVRPSKPISIDDIPKRIKEIIINTRINMNIKDLSKVSLSDKGEIQLAQV